jgi:hypothetical protein
VLEVDSGFAHACMLSPAAAPSSTQARANGESVQPIHTPGSARRGAIAAHSRTFHDDASRPVRRILARHTGKDWTLCDAISFAVLEARHARRAFTFDHHFRQYGRIQVLGLKG